MKLAFTTLICLAALLSCTGRQEIRLQAAADAVAGAEAMALTQDEHERAVILGGVTENVATASRTKIGDWPPPSLTPAEVAAAPDSYSATATLLAEEHRARGAFAALLAGALGAAGAVLMGMCRASTPLGTAISRIIERVVCGRKAIEQLIGAEAMQDVAQRLIGVIENAVPSEQADLVKRIVADQLPPEVRDTLDRYLFEQGFLRRSGDAG